MCRKLILFAFFSLALPQIVLGASLYSVQDGWTRTDNDTYASQYDTLTINWGSDIDSRYTFDASNYTEVWCLENAEVSRAQSYTIGGTYVTNLPTYGHATVSSGGNDWTLQVVGGTGAYCRFYLWKNREAACKDVWLTTSAAYTTAGCPVGALSGDLNEGDTSSYTVDGDSVSISCVKAETMNFIKCQAPTYAQLNNCIEDSANNIDGGDNYQLSEACYLDDSSDSDTTHTCDVAPVGTGWELNVFRASTLDSVKQELYLNGIPNATFNVWTYSYCGAFTFTRELVATVNLTQFTAKGSYCTNDKNYSVYGVVTGYLPWLGKSNNYTLNYTYGANKCSAGNVCNNQTPLAQDYNVNVLACFHDGGATCYDSRRNQDETEIDYGGVCGNCSGDGKNSDTYWSVAIDTQGAGYFSSARPFNSTLYCPEAENATNFMMVLVTILSAGLLLVIIIVFFLAMAGIGVVTIPLIRGLWGKKRKKE